MIISVLVIILSYSHYFSYVTIYPCLVTDLYSSTHLILCIHCTVVTSSRKYTTHPCSSNMLNNHGMF